MRTVFVPALVAAGLMTALPAMAQSWVYVEETDPDTEEVELLRAQVFRYEGGSLKDGIIVQCSESSNGMEIWGLFLDAVEEPFRSAKISWRVNGGEVMEFSTDRYNGRVYQVIYPDSLHLARMLVDARQFTTSNGGEGLAERTLEFENLGNGEQVERVLKACGY